MYMLCAGLSIVRYTREKSEFHNFLGGPPAKMLQLGSAAIRMRK